MKATVYETVSASKDITHILTNNTAIHLGSEKRIFFGATYYPIRYLTTYLLEASKGMRILSKSYAFKYIFFSWSQMFGLTGRGCGRMFSCTLFDSLRHFHLHLRYWSDNCLCCWDHHICVCWSIIITMHTRDCQIQQHWGILCAWESW